MSSFAPLGEEKLSCTGIPLSCCKLDLLTCTGPGMEQEPLKEGRRWGSGLAYPAPSPSPHTRRCCLSRPPCMDAHPGQVPIPQGQAGNCFPLVRSFGCHLCSLHRPGGCCSIHRNPKFTQQAWNDRQQSLSLLITEMSLLTKAVLQNRVTLHVITFLPGGTCDII